MSQKRLRERAAEAMRLLESSPATRYVHHRHDHGLEWVIERRDQHWRLAVAREDAFPVGLEVTVLRNAFGVPMSVEDERSVKERRHAKTGRMVRYFVVEMTWIERLLVQARNSQLPATAVQDPDGALLPR